MPSNKRIAVWVSDKKLQKMNWQEFEVVCGEYGFEVFKLNLEECIESQGPFSVFVHKLTDIIASADMGDIKCINTIQEVKNYITRHPSLIVIDPLPNVTNLLDRYTCYTTIHSTDLYTYEVFTPNFCILKSNNPNVTKQELKRAMVTFPFICKPILGHGSRRAHEMSIIFNEQCLVDIRTPCVAQTFINHNAVLYKIFIVGDRHHYVERPSLKNFSGHQGDTIHFASSDVSKADSKSRLCVLDPSDVTGETVKPDQKIIDVIATTLRAAFGMELIGVDVVIEKCTGRYAIIDVNFYPGYDGFPNFYEALLECISNKYSSHLT